MIWNDTVNLWYTCVAVEKYCVPAFVFLFFPLFFSGRFYQHLIELIRKGVRGMFTAEQIRELIKKDRTDIFYNSWEWRKLAESVKDENHNECYMCNQCGKYRRATIVHHVKHLKQFPELAYERFYIDENGNKQIQLMPVCYWCHEDFHPKEWHKSKKARYENEEKW